MPPEVPAPGSPQDWLRHARSDLSVARGPRLGEILLETLCFHAQPAAEKAIKAVLVHLGIAFPRTHALAALLDLLPSDLTVPPDVSDAVGLTDFAVTSRYPGDYEPVTEEEHHIALRQADAVLRWAEAVIVAR